MTPVLGDTDLIREQLRSWKGRFTVRDLKPCRSVYSVINRLERFGEIRDTGETLPSLRKCTRPSKIYEVVQIKSAGDTSRIRSVGNKYAPRKKTKEATPTPYAAWADIYPDLFHVHPVMHSCMKVTFAVHADFFD